MMAGKISDLLPISAQIKTQFQFTFSPVKSRYSRVGGPPADGCIQMEPPAVQ